MCDGHDYPTVYREKIVRSRKPRRCCECSMPIAIGDRYENVFGVWDGNANTYSTCLACADLREAMVTVDLCPMLSQLDETIDNYDASHEDEIAAYWQRREVACAAKFGVMSIPPPRDLQPAGDL